MSMGLEMAKVAEYSTMPRALRGANWMSVMMALCGSLGSSSPKKWPLRVSNLPALPNACAFVGGRLALFDDDACDAGVERDASEQCYKGGTDDHVWSL